MGVAMFGNGGDAKWKGKYDELRRELRQQERDWSEIEALLQKAVNRVAIAAAGTDPRLDAALDRIRSGVKGNLDRKRLDSGLNALAEAVKEIEARPRAGQRSATGAGNAASPGDLLIAILERLSFEESLRAEFLKTIEFLSRFPDDREQIQSKVVELLNGSLAAAQRARAVSAPPAGSAAVPASGVESTPGLDAKTLAGAVAVFLRRFDLDRNASRAVLARIREPVRESLEATLDELAGRLHLLLDGRQESARDSVAAAPASERHTPGSGSLELRRLLQALAERLGQIEDLEQAAAEMQTRLQEPIADSEWLEILEDLADTLARVMDSIRRQKAELESFIGQVGEQLGQFEVFVRTSQDDLDSARSDRQTLSTQLGDEMQNIRANMDGAQSIDELKRSVVGSLTLIAERIQSFKLHEESRIAAAEERNRELIRQMDSLRFEAKRLKEENEENLEQLMLDPLTKVHSRYAYEKRLEEEFSRWQRYRQPLSFVIWDIDRFKAVNDTYGHKAGDRLLQMVARLLARNSRKSDFLARIGGEEFVMLLPGTRAGDALVIANKLRRVVAETEFHYKNKPRPITVSAGITEFVDNDVPDTVYQRADGGLYKAKNGGRNRCELA